MKKLENYNMDTKQVLFSSCLTILGVTTYYLCPQAFLRHDYELFFQIQCVILMFIVIGMVLIMLLVFPFLQELVLNVAMCFTCDWRLKPVIVKNMKQNRNRNSKTAVMFAMCLSFLMFGGCYTSLSVEII